MIVDQLLVQLEVLILMLKRVVYIIMSFLLLIIKERDHFQFQLKLREMLPIQFGLILDTRFKIS